MSSTVNVGTLQGVLEMRDLFTAQMNNFEARLKSLEDKITKSSRNTRTETDKIGDAYKRVAASLDPTVANTQKYEKSANALGNALKAGLITQAQHNKFLDQAKEKYLSASAHTLTWREEVYHLTEKITGLSNSLGPFGKEAGEVFEGISRWASGLLPIFSSLASEGPALLSLAGAVVALGVAFVELEIIKKSAEFISEAVQEGLKFQLVLERLNNALQLNGSASGLSAKEMVGLAEGFELVTGRTKEEIVAAETVLSRFDHLGKESFPRALRSSLAYAKATGESAETMAKKLGPALEGNTKSLAGLRDIGIVLTAGQKKMMTQLIETGDRAQYQALLFDILDEKIGETGDTIDNNLTRQMQRAHIVGEEFKEGIASEVIPALEDLVETVVNSLGGWETMKRVITSIGHDVGDQVRQLVYGIAIAYHEWMANHDILVINYQRGFRAILSAVESFADTMASLPLPGAEVWQGIAASVSKSIGSLDSSIKSHQKSVVEHASAIVDLGKKYKEHRQALEGDEKVHQKLSSAIDGVSSAAKNQKSAMDSVEDSIGSMQSKVKNLISAYLAATMGVKAYNAEILRQKIESAILVEENKLRETGRHLTADQRNAIAAAVIEEQNLTNATKLTLQAWEKLAQLAASVSIFAVTASVKELGALIAKIQTDMANRGQELTEQYMTDEKKKVKAVREAYELLQSGNISQQTYDKIKLENAIQWTAETTRTYDEFVRIQERISIIADDLAGALTNTLISGLREGKLEVQAIGDAIEDVFLTTLGDIIDKWLSEWFKAMASWLARWIATQRTAAVVSAASTGGAGGGGAGGASGLFGMGAQAYSAYTGSGAATSAGALAGYAAAAYGIFVVYKAFIEDHHEKFASISLSGEGAKAIASHGQKYLAGVQAAADVILKSLSQFISDIKLSVEQYGTVIIKSSKSGFGVSLPGSGGAGQIFKTMEEAIAYAQVLMLKFAKFSDSVSLMVKSVIANTRTMTPDRLASDIAFARELESQNLSEVAKTIQSAIDLAISQWNKAKQLFATVFSIDMPAWAEATSSIMTRLVGSIQEQFNQLAGIEEDPKKAWLRQEEAFNQNKKMVELQLKLWLVEINARIANYKSNQAWVGGLGGVTKSTLGYAYAMSEVASEIDPGLEALKDLADEIQRQIDNLPRDLTPDDYPGTKGGKGGGVKDQLRDTIKDKTWELYLNTLTDSRRAIEELNHQYDIWIAQAGKDKNLKDQLLKLKEKELALLQKEQVDNLLGSFKEFLHLTTPFDQVRKTATDLIKKIEDSPFGSARKAKMIERVLADLDKQLKQLSMENAQSLLGSMISDMEKFGASESLMMEARQNFAILEHTLKLAHYHAEIEILRAQGALSVNVLALLDKSLAFLDSIDPTKFILPTPANDNGGGSGYSSSGNVTTYDDFITAKDRIIDQLDEWNRLPLGDLASKAAELNSSFSKLMADVDKVKQFGWDFTQQALEAFNNAKNAFLADTFKSIEELGLSELDKNLAGIDDKFKDIKDAFIALGASQEDLQRLEEDRVAAIAEAMKEAFSNVQDLYNSLVTGDNAALTTEEKFKNAQSEYARILAEVQSGDYSELDKLGAAGDNLAKLYASMYGTSTQGYVDFKNTLLSQLGDVLNFDIPDAPTDTGTSNNVIQFPQVLIDNSSESVQAMHEVADVVNIRSAKQENLLGKIVSVLDELLKETRAGNETPGGGYVYGNV